MIEFCSAVVWRMRQLRRRLKLCTVEQLPKMRECEMHYGDKE